MWNTENSRKIALAEGRYVETGDSHYQEEETFIPGMAMILGSTLTIEIMMVGNAF